MKALLFLSSVSLALMTSAMNAQTQDSLTTDFIQQQPAIDINHALQERITGIDFDRNATPTIRGVRSLTESANVHYELNGMPFYGTLADIDPAEIVSVKILKDAATAAMYGARGRDGVILINTRHADAPQQAKVSYQGYVANKQAFARYPMMDAHQLRVYRRMHGETVVYDGLGESSWTSRTYNYNENINTDIDRQDIYETGWEHKHLLSLATSFQSGFLYGGIGHTTNDGILPNDATHTTNIHFDLTQRWGQYISMDLSARYAYENKKVNGGDFKKYILLSPMLSENTPIDSAMHYAYGKGKYDRYYFNFMANVRCPWVEGLSYRVKATRDGNFTNALPYYNYQEPSQKRNQDVSARRRFVVVSNEVNYDKEWGTGHRLSLMGAYTTEKNVSHYRAHSASIYSYRTYQQSSKVQDSKDTYRRQLYSSGYDYRGRYEARWTSQAQSYDGSYSYEYFDIEMITQSSPVSTSQYKSTGEGAPKLDWAGSHALHLQWNIHREGFARNWTWLDQLSVRADQGIIKNPQYFLINGEQEEYEQKFRSKNLGLDFSLWNGRLSGSFDLYKQQNKHEDKFMVPIMSTSYTTKPYSTVLQSGCSENRGFELSLQGIIIDHWHDWTWQAGIGLYANRDKLTSMHYEDGYQTTSYEGLIGKPIHTAKTAIINYDKRMQEYDYVSEEPYLKGHFSTRLSWRDWDLNVIGSFQAGGHLYSDCATISPNYNYVAGYPTNRPNTDYQFEDHTNDNHYVTNSNDLTYRSCYDATICRIRVITLGYNLPKKWLERCQLSQMRLYATARNPFVLASDLYDELGIDPVSNTRYKSTHSPDSNHSVNMVTFGVPTTRDYLIGLNITF